MVSTDRVSVGGGAEAPPLGTPLRGRSYSTALEATDVAGSHTPEGGISMASISSLRDTVEQVRKRIQQHRGLDEQNTKGSLIDPVFRALGWDMEDPDEVRREYKQQSSDSPADYALFVAGEPRLFVEAKKLGSNLDDRRWARQVIGYAATAGVEWVVLTDGNEYRIYNSHATVPVEQKLLRLVRLTDENDQDLAVLELLSKAKVRERYIDSVWEAHHVDQQVLSALEGLFTPEPDPSLVRLLGKRLKGLTKGQIIGGLKRIRASFETSPSDAPPSEPPQDLPASTVTAVAGSTRPLSEADYIEAIRAFLAAQPGRRASLEQIRAAVERALPLTAADRAIEDGGCHVWWHRVASALSRMKRRGELLNPSRGVWELAEEVRAAQPGPRRGRPAGGASVADLIAAGLIHPPTEVEATYLNQRVTATINERGEFELAGEVFTSPSIAGGRARGLVKGDGRIYSTNGWDFWHVRQPDGSLVTLSALRSRLGKGP